MSANNSGVSAGYVDNAVSRLRHELIQKIQELESQMINLAEKVVQEIRSQTESMRNTTHNQTNKLSSDIGTQTGALVAQAIAQIKILHDSHGELVTANTKIALQTEAELQIEIVKKVGAYIATKSKLISLEKDIESRFGKSYESVYINRQLYNNHFQSIIEDYSKKIKTIARHIYEIAENDIAPAIDAANRPQIQIFDLPVEVDLLRLKARAESLDETLQLLRSARLDDVLLAMNKLRTRIEDCYKLDGVSRDSERSFAVEGLLLTANGNDTLLVESLVSTLDVQGEKIIRLSQPEDDFKKYYDKSNLDAALQAISQRPTRKPTVEEGQALVRAAAELQSEKVISKESVELFTQFLSLNLLKLTE